MNDIIKIYLENRLLGIIIKSEYKSDGINFLTDHSSPFQIACMHHKPRHEIKPHLHNLIERKICKTQEVLFIKKGKIRVDFFRDDQTIFKNYTLTDGDIIFLASGSHGFEIIEETEMIEVKQGPYVGEKDKTRFIPKSGNDNEKR